MAPLSEKIEMGYENFQPLMSVQELAKENLIKIPKSFRLHHDEDEQSKDFDDSNSLPQIPTIDMKKLVMEDSKEFHLQKLHSTCKDWGFFQLVNHGVESSLLKTLENEIEGFFKLPLEQKLKYAMKPGEVEGYGSMARSDQTFDWGDRFYITTNPIRRRKPHLFPELPSSLRDTLEIYVGEIQKIAKTLFGLFAKALKMDMKEMELFEDGLQSIRMTYYPPCPQPNLVMGFRAHSDASGITILNQINRVNGLELKKDGVWIPVNFLPHSLAVNVGDILSILSNGIYNSIEHRAIVNSEKERISIALFFNPKLEAQIGPSISLINPKNPPLFKTVNMENYVKDYFLYRLLDGKKYLEHMKIKDKENNSNLIES